MMTPFGMRKLAFGFLGIAIVVIAAGVVLTGPSPKSEERPPETLTGSVATERYSARVDRVDVTFEQWDYTRFRLTTNGAIREGELNTERGFKDDEDATVYLLNWRKPEGEHIYYVRLADDPTHLYVLDGNREIIRGSALTKTP